MNDLCNQILAARRDRQVQSLMLRQRGKLSLEIGDEFNAVANPAFLDGKVVDYLQPSIRPGFLETFESSLGLYEFVRHKAVGFVFGDEVKELNSYRFKICKVMDTWKFIDILFFVKPVGEATSSFVDFQKATTSVDEPKYIIKKPVSVYSTDSSVNVPTFKLPRGMLKNSDYAPPYSVELEKRIRKGLNKVHSLNFSKEFDFKPIIGDQFNAFCRSSLKSWGDPTVSQFTKFSYLGYVKFENKFESSNLPTLDARHVKPGLVYRYEITGVSNQKRIFFCRPLEYDLNSEGKFRQNFANVNYLSASKNL